MFIHVLVRFFISGDKLIAISPNKKKMRLERKGNFRFEAKNPRGLSVEFDVPAMFGGEEAAPLTYGGSASMPCWMHKLRCGEHS